MEWPNCEPITVVKHVTGATLDHLAPAEWLDNWLPE